MIAKLPRAIEREGRDWSCSLCQISRNSSRSITIKTLKAEVGTQEEFESVDKVNNKLKETKAHVSFLYEEMKKVSKSETNLKIKNIEFVAVNRNTLKVIKK